MIDKATEVALLQATQAEQLDLQHFELNEGKEQQTTATQITLKCGDSFLITDVSGDLPASRQEVGLFRHGTRFIRTCNLYLEGEKLIALSHQVAHMSDASHIDLTNAPFATQENVQVEQGSIHIDRFLELEQDYLTQTFTITNFHSTTIPITLSAKLGSDFCDLFEVRGFAREKHGTMLPTQIANNEIILGYRGLDQKERATHIQLEPAATKAQADRVDWRLLLERGVPVTIRITMHMGESSKEKLSTGAATTIWRSSHHPSIMTDDPVFNRLLKRGIQDIMMLSTMTAHGYYPYAGIPWFCCPFGRDGLIAALEFLPWFPQVARGTLEFLAAYQGIKVDDFTDEEPGKILHEFRTGEMANCREIPYIPYYGTVDATPLFLILLEAYVRWTGDVELAKKLWPNAEAAATWMMTYADKDGDTFLEYHCASEKGLSNQGWKDSWDGINHSDGRVARSPLALSEVQGYAYAGYRAVAFLAHKLGLVAEETQWNQAAETIQHNFLEQFWWEEEQVVYQGLAENKERCDVVSSNAGQCLWTGILPDELAQRMITRLMQEDMFSGWGIRTLSSKAKLFNPMSYHNGSVWPHDSALIGAGMALYGGKEEAGKVLKSLYDASNHFADARLPELYCGFDRREGYGPTRYPVSCSPQAWAAGSPFVLISSLLGMNPNAAEHRLTLHQPTLPDWLNALELKGMYVGERKVHLRFVRVEDRTEVVLGSENEVEIQII